MCRDSGHCEVDTRGMRLSMRGPVPASGVSTHLEARLWKFAAKDTGSFVTRVNNSTSLELNQMYNGATASSPQSLVYFK